MGLCNSLPHKFQELCGEEGMGQVGYGCESMNIDLISLESSVEVQI